MVAKRLFGSPPRWVIDLAADGTCRVFDTIASKGVPPGVFGDDKQRLAHVPSFKIRMEDREFLKRLAEEAKWFKPTAKPTIKRTIKPQVAAIMTHPQVARDAVAHHLPARRLLDHVRARAGRSRAVRCNR